ncbi:MAG: diguanylate cyclase [Trueperaceae bacterium]|nr:diguanylate cyclase [Trueperaceae bacterium]
MNTLLDDVLSSLNQLSASKKVLFILSLILAIGIIDYVSGPQLSMTLFYLLPISLSVWIQSPRAGIITASVAAMVLLIADLMSLAAFSSFVIPLWNVVIRFGVFMVICFSLSALKEILERERHLARTDALTGALNTRAFLTTLEREVRRARRYDHPFTVSYIDLDNFKQVNDQHGHARGDEVLKMVVETLRSNLREVDTLARLGGDEFIILLPETNADAAMSALEKLKRELLSKMTLERLPVTLSAGVITFVSNYPDPDEIIRETDALMYRVKTEGKNDLIFSTFF